MTGRNQRDGDRSEEDKAGTDAKKDGGMRGRKEG